jgi:hypothetical protein
MKLKSAGFLLLAVAGCANAPPVRPEPLEVGHNIYYYCATKAVRTWDGWTE